jgi:hypothetical protein
MTSGTESVGLHVLSLLTVGFSAYAAALTAALAFWRRIGARRHNRHV